MGEFDSECLIFSNAIYCSNSSVVPVYIMKMSSINLFPVWMYSVTWFIKCVSSLPMNRLVYAGAILVPMAVPWICK